MWASYNVSVIIINPIVPVIKWKMVTVLAEGMIVMHVIQSAWNLHGQHVRLREVTCNSAWDSERWHVTRLCVIFGIQAKLGSVCCVDMNISGPAPQRKQVSAAAPWRKLRRALIVHNKAKHVGLPQVSTLLVQFLPPLVFPSRLGWQFLFTEITTKKLRSTRMY